MSLSRPADVLQKSPPARVQGRSRAGFWRSIQRLLSVTHSWFRSLIRIRELHPPSLARVVCVVCFVSFGRTELEIITLGLNGASSASLVNNTAFYLQAAYLFAFLASKLSGRRVDTVMGVVTMGLYAGMLPPVVDAVILGLGKGRYTYVDGGFGVWKWTLVDPQYFSVGESVALWFVVAIFAAYVGEVTRSWRRTAVAALLAYAAVMFIAMVPSSLVQVIAGWLYLSSSEHLALLSTLQLVVAQAAYLGTRPALAKRLSWRLVHALPFVALVFLGASIAAWFQALDYTNPSRLVVTSILAMGILMLCVTALVQNDAFDAGEDRDRTDGTNASDAHFFTAVAILFVLAICVASAAAGAPMVLFLIVAVMYSFPFGRVKRSFPGNYLAEGLWGWSAFLTGASAPLIAHKRTEASAGVLIGSALVFLGWFLFNAFKDLKDIRSDLRANNQTLYVWALRRGVPLAVVHRRFCRALAIALFIPLLGLIGVGISVRAVTAAALVSLPLVFRALNGPPTTSSVRRFLVSVAIYVSCIAIAIELTLAELA